MVTDILENEDVYKIVKALGPVELVDPTFTRFVKRHSDDVVIGVLVDGLGAVTAPIRVTPRLYENGYYLNIVVDLHWFSEPSCFLSYVDRCIHLDAPCWNDCTFLREDEVVAALRSDGVQGVWSYIAEAWLPELKERAA